MQKGKKTEEDSPGRRLQSYITFRHFPFLLFFYITSIYHSLHFSWQLSSLLIAWVLCIPAKFFGAASVYVNISSLRYSHETSKIYKSPSWLSSHLHIKMEGMMKIILILLNTIWEVIVLLNGVVIITMMEDTHTFLRFTWMTWIYQFSR